MEEKDKGRMDIKESMENGVFICMWCHRWLHPNEWKMIIEQEVVCCNPCYHVWLNPEMPRGRN